MEIGSPSALTLSLSKGEGRSDGPALVVAARNVAVVARGGVLGYKAVLDIARQRGRIAVLRVAETGTARGVETGDFAGRDGLGALAAELLAAGKTERARLAVQAAVAPAGREVNSVVGRQQFEIGANGRFDFQHLAEPAAMRTGTARIGTEFLAVEYDGGDRFVDLDRGAAHATGVRRRRQAVLTGRAPVPPLVTAVMVKSLLSFAARSVAPRMVMFHRHDAPSAGTRSGAACARQPKATSGSIWPMTWREQTGDG